MPILWTAAIVGSINDFVGFDRQAETDVSDTCFPVRKKHDRDASKVLFADRFAVMEKRPIIPGRPRFQKDLKMRSMFMLVALVAVIGCLLYTSDAADE